jgi:type I site-specific restriction endonuclease
MLEELEWKTRKERVDRKFKSLHPAWSIVKYRPDIDVASLACHAVEEYPTHSGPADYALFVKGRFLGIIEAKKVGVGPAGVLEQAKRYAWGAEDGPGNWRGYRVPFLYSTNGEVIHFLESKAMRRVLFLVDRRALTAQAVREFAAFNTPKGLKFDQEYDVFSQRFRREDFDDEKPYDPKVATTSKSATRKPRPTWTS